MTTGPKPVRILVIAASRQSATAEIASRIGITLAEQLMARRMAREVHVRHAERVPDIDGYDAVVLGSAVYLGHWLKPARDLARTYAAQLATIPVWLFSSCPAGDPPAEPPEVAELAALTGAREHRMFAGLLDQQRLGLSERMVVRAVQVVEGDRRDWTAVTTWATGIADALSQVPKPTPHAGSRIPE